MIYTIQDDSLPPVGSVVHVWHVIGHRRHYINHVPEGMDASCQRITSYGVRGPGQGEDGRAHDYDGWGVVISRDADTGTVRVQMHED